jgi:hypothetical protein
MPLSDLIDDLDSDPQLRAVLMYFPERAAERYGLKDSELAAIKTGDLSALPLGGVERERLRRKLSYHGI